jgi:hypothetical protein
MGLFDVVRDYVRGLQDRERGKYADAPLGAVAPTRGEADAEPVAESASVTAPVEARRWARVKAIETEGLRVLDLGDLPSMRLRIVGTGYVVPEAAREVIGRDAYLLIREPRNRADRNAVAVHWEGARVGYLTRAKAAAYAPVLDGMAADAFRVTGAAPRTEHSIVLWLNLPLLPALRTFAKGQA